MTIGFTYEDLVAQVNPPRLMDAYSTLSHTAEAPHGSLPDRVAVAGTYWLAGGQLSRPLRARLMWDEGQLIARDERTGIAGCGESLAEALVDLRTALVEYRDVLEDSGPLSSDLQARLGLLHEVLV